MADCSVARDWRHRARRKRSRARPSTRRSRG